MPGHFFVIDGADGAGKTTQLERAEKRLAELHPDREILRTREPGGSPYAENIRRLILDPDAKDVDGVVMAQLFGAARFEHLNRTVIPALGRGMIVLCDRFDGSTYAYQLFAQSGGHQARGFFNLQRQYIKDHYLPFWSTIILDVDAETGQKRRLGRQDQESTHFDERKLAFHEMVRSGFQQYAKDYPEGVTIIDARRSVEEIHLDIMDVLTKVIG